MYPWPVATQSREISRVTWRNCRDSLDVLLVHGDNMWTTTTSGIPGVTFPGVTLVGEDSARIEAHRMILASINCDYIAAALSQELQCSTAGTPSPERQHYAGTAHRIVLQESSAAVRDLMDGPRVTTTAPGPRRRRSRSGADLRLPG